MAVEKDEGSDVKDDVVMEPELLALINAEVVEAVDEVLLPVDCVFDSAIDIVVEIATVVLALSAVVDVVAFAPAGEAMVGRPDSDSGCCEPDGLSCDGAEDAAGEAPGEEVK